MKKNLLRPLLVSGLVVCFAIQGWRYLEYVHYRNAIPSAIGVSSLVISGSNISLLEALILPLPPDDCGGAIFSMSHRTARAIQESGIEYFNQVAHGRGRDGGRPTHKYGDWKETPVPYSWVSEGSWPGLFCIRGRYRYGYPEAQVLSAAKKPGSYYTSSTRGGQIIVIPDLKLVSYTF